MIRSIELALTSQDIAEVTQTLLNLAEFMEHSDKVDTLLDFLTLVSQQVSSAWKGCEEFMHTCTFFLLSLFFFLINILLMYVLYPGSTAFER